MTDYEQMIETITAHGIRYVEREVAGRTGTFTQRGNRRYIFVSPQLSSPEKLIRAAHELGHAYDGGPTAGHGKREARAKRFAANSLISPSDVISAILKGCRDIHEIAEFLNLPSDFVNEAIQLMRAIHGPQLLTEQFELNLDPVFVRDRISGEVYPE